MFRQTDGGSADSSAAKCACVADEYYNGTACVACAAGTISFGQTESCMSCTNTLCPPSPAPTASLPPTTSLAPTIFDWSWGLP